ncbi:efflux RND transporter periplasmic adaptor subunit [Pseudomonas sp. AMR01]|uniref:efflux RND transporter periplasmic adaptor subunit n=1 Tax=Pseudomonas sp. AMR01 TaxID=3064904 RepID=UPI0035BFCF54
MVGNSSRFFLTTSALLTSILLSACRQESTPSVETAAPVVNVASATSAKIADWEEFNGRVAAVESVAIRPRVSGYILKVVYQEGAEVKKGDLLFEIDPRPYQAAVNSAKADRERAKANLEYAQKDAIRAEKLLPFKAISQKVADDALRSQRQAQSELDAAQSYLAVAQLNLEFTKVRSPINGKTSKAQSTVGNLAIADQSVMTTVVSQNPVYVYFDPDEKSYIRNNIKSRDSQKFLARVGLADDANYPHKGVLSFIDNEVNASTGTIRARITIDNSDRSLTPGLYAKVQLAAEDKSEVVLIEETSIITDQDRKYVYVVTSENVAQRRDVKIGKAYKGLRVVTSGLLAGDTVVTSGHQHITGAEVAVIPMYSAAEKKVAEFNTLDPSASR